MIAFDPVIMGNSAFSQEQFNSIYPDGIENHYWNHARNRIIRKLLRKNQIFGGKILEIGCGKGVVVKYLRDQKIDCYGVELADVKVPLSLAPYVSASVNAFTLPQEFRESIDTVMILDVIEHLENPESFVNSILSSFSHITHIVVTVPARQELWTNYDTFNGHFRRYSLSDIVHLNDENLVLQEAGYFNHILYPFFLIIAWLIRNRGTSIKAPSGMGIALHRFLSWILQTDYFLFPRKLAGTSIIALFSVRNR
jgi:hypothetical protein